MAPEDKAMIRAVIFDIGGPIDMEVEFEAAIDADIRAGLAREGFVVDDDRWLAANRQAVDRFAPSLYRAVIWELTDGDDAAAMRIYDWMEARAAERDLFALRPGIAEVLEALKQRHLTLGLAANQPLKALEALSREGIGAYFANPGVSGHYGYRKPDLRLFLRVCEDLDVLPTDCVMVGDRIDNDVVPARLLGMRTVLFRTGRHRDQQARSWDERPDVEVDAIEDLLPAILSLLDEPVAVAASPSPPAVRGTEGEG
jgi:putative hydrolase of the HAD superfamily